MIFTDLLTNLGLFTE